jgi:hypothetical protein
VSGDPQTIKQNLFPHPQEVHSAVSKDEAHEFEASWFEMRGYTALLTMRRDAMIVLLS